MSSSETLLEDGVLTPFFEDDFDPDSYSRGIIRQDAPGPSPSESSVESTLRLLRSRSESVDAAVKSLVSTHRDELVENSQRTRESKARVSDLSARTNSLLQSSSRIEQDVLHPLRDLQRDASVLRRVVQVQELLRKAQQHHGSVRRLRSLLLQSPVVVSSSPSPSPSSPDPSPDRDHLAQQLAQPRLLTRVAAVLREVECGLADTALGGVQVVERDRAWVGTVSAAAREQARRLLARATQQLSPADVDAALQALHDLGCLAVEVIAVLDRAVEAAAASVREQLDVRGVALAAQASMDGGAAAAAAATAAAVAAGSSAAKNAGFAQFAPVAPAFPSALGTTSRGGLGLVSPPAGAAAAWRGALWNRCEMMCEALQRASLQAWNVIYVVCRRREIVSTGHGAPGKGATAFRSPFLADVAAAFAAAGEAQQQLAFLKLGEPAAGSSTVARQLVAGPTTSEFAAQAQGIQPHLAELLLADDVGDLSLHSSQNSPPLQHPGVRLLRRFFAALSLRLREDLASLAAGGDDRSFVRSTLVEGYPRLHYLLRDVLPRVARSVALRASDDERDALGALGGFGNLRGGTRITTASASAALPQVGSAQVFQHLTGVQIFAAACESGHGAPLLRALAPLQRLYLARSLSRMTDALGAMFGATGSDAGRAAAAARRAGAGAGAGAGAQSSLRLLPVAAVPVTAAGFTPAASMERLLDQEVGFDAPTIQATQNLARAITAELAACRPPPGLFAAAGSTAAPAPGAAVLAPGSNRGSASAGNSPPLQLQTQQQSQLQAPQPPPQLFQLAGADPELLAAVARGVATALRLLVAQAELATVVGPAAVAVAEHFMPTPAQISNHALACRLDELRHAVIRACAELPLLPPCDRLFSAFSADTLADDPEFRQLSAARLQQRPLALALPPHLLMLAAAADVYSSTPSFPSAIDGVISSAVPEPLSSTAHAAASTAQATVLRALDGVDRFVEALVLPWAAAVVCPLERCILRLHEEALSLPQGSLVSAADSATLAAASGSVASAGDSEWVGELESCAAGLSSHQLPLLPQGSVADSVRGALAGRLLRLFSRHACLVRLPALQKRAPPGAGAGQPAAVAGAAADDAVRLRLARDCAHVEVAVAPLWPVALARLGAPYTSLRALRPLVFASSADIALALQPSAGAFASATAAALVAVPAPALVSGKGDVDGPDSESRRLRASLAALRPADLLHHCIARLPPRECALPHARARLSLLAYSDAVDAAAASALSGAGASAGVGAADALAAARARLQPPHLALIAADAFVARGVMKCLDDFSVRNAVGGALSSSFDEVAIAKDVASDCLRRFEAVERSEQSQS